MNKGGFVYFKNGINYYRYPQDLMKEEGIDINQIEVLFWNSPESFSFVKNDLSYSFGENNDLKILKQYTSLSELGIYQSGSTLDYREIVANANLIKNYYKDHGSILTKRLSQSGIVSFENIESAQAVRAYSRAPRAKKSESKKVKTGLLVKQ